MTFLLKPRQQSLFLTSKVRLHCDQSSHQVGSLSGDLFLTSKVRLHCDVPLMGPARYRIGLFLTSKVRLHCDNSFLERPTLVAAAFS